MKRAHHHSRPLLTVTLLLVVALLTALGPASPASAETIDRVAAVVDGQVITFNDMRRQGPLVVGRTLEELDRQSLAERDANVRFLIDELVNFEILVKYARRAPNPPTEADLRRQLDASGRFVEAEMRAALEAQGIRYEDWWQFMVRKNLADFVISSEIDRQARVQDQDVRLCALEALPDGEMTSKVQLRQILVPAPNPATVVTSDTAIGQALQRGFYQAVEAGRYSFAAQLHRWIAEDTHPFEELVARYQPGPLSRNGGLLSQMYAPGELGPEFGVVFDLEVGEVAEPILTPEGYRILRVESRQQVVDERWLREMAKCRTELEQTVRLEVRKAWIAEHRASSFISVPVFDELAR